MTDEFLEQTSQVEKSAILGPRTEGGPMNLRCFYCQTPFTLGQSEKLSALQKMQTENLQHYDAYCPNCRRANPVSRERLEIFTPGWQQALQQMSQGQAPSPPAAPKPEQMMPER